MLVVIVLALSSFSSSWQAPPPPSASGGVAGRTSSQSPPASRSFSACERSESGSYILVQHLLISNGNQCGNNLEELRHSSFWLSYNFFLRSNFYVLKVDQLYMGSMYAPRHFLLF